MTKKRYATAGVAAVTIFGAVLVALQGFELDTPAWTNIPGVDIPLIGDTDAIDCRLTQIDSTRNVRIKIVDGDAASYDSYVHVWNNGNLIDPDRIQRVDQATFIVPSADGVDEQWYSISIIPVRDGRVYCESVTLQ